MKIAYLVSSPVCLLSFLVNSISRYLQLTQRNCNSCKGCVYGGVSENIQRKEKARSAKIQWTSQGVGSERKGRHLKVVYYNSGDETGEFVMENMERSENCLPDS